MSTIIIFSLAHSKSNSIYIVCISTVSSGEIHKELHKQVPQYYFLV